MVGSPVDGLISTASMPPGNSENLPYLSGVAGFCPSTVISDLNKPGLIRELQPEKYRSITGNHLGHAKVFYPDMLEC